MSELKPCPFCGSEPYSYHDNDTDFGGVKCNLGGCACSDIEIDEICWNTRPIEDALTARISELEAAQRWIPVSERLPEAGHKVLVLLTDGAISIDFIHGNDFLGNPDFYEYWVGDITHWMPLPQPPEVQE